MTHEEILSILDKAPPPAGERMVYFHSVYTQIYGWVAGPDKLWLCEFLPKIAKESSNRMRILEIGVFNGGTSRGLIALTGGIFVGIDNFMDFSGEGARSLMGATDGPDAFWRTLKYHPDLSAHVDRLIVGNSQDIGQTWSDPIDLVLFDADHNTEPLKADLSLFCPHIAVGGYALVDDYDMGTVQQAVGEYFSQEKWETIRIPDVSTTAKIFAARRKDN